MTAMLSAVACTSPQTKTPPQVIAHRGCWLEDLVPENSISGVRMARRYGYPAIECDVKYTLDSVMVLMHDGTINRTMRNAADYSVIEEPVKVNDILFEDLRANYVFASDDPAERVQIPTLEELLLACKECGIHPVLHSEVEESYRLAQEILGDDWTAFSVDYDKMAYARSISGCDILWDPGELDAEGTIAKLENLGGKTGMSTMNWRMLDSTYIATVRNAGHEVQSSIFASPHEADAIHYGASYILSDFCWLQQEGRTPVYAGKYENLPLNVGSCIPYKYPEIMDYGAMTISITFSGNVQIIINGKRIYSFTSAEKQTRNIGVRFSRTKPEYLFTTGTGCEIYDCEANIYAI